MSYKHNTCFVAQIALGDGTTYYMCSSSRLSGFDMDGNTYNPYIIDIGNAEKIGNFGEGSAIGKCSMRVLFAQSQYQGAFNLDISKPWNNGTCTIKIRNVDSVNTWEGCENYYKGIIKDFKINNDSLDFSVEDQNHKDSIILPKYTVENVISGISTLSESDIPKDSVGKFVPMQFGNLNDAVNGKFGKGILVSSRIGMQKIYFDNSSLTDLDSIGMWESGSKRYFEGRAENEYTIHSDKNHIDFFVDSTTTLNENLLAASGVQTILVADSSKLIWQSEEDVEGLPDELLTVNIIGIDNELMMLVEKPDGNTIRVERGYNNTTVATHTSGTKIYQCAKFSAKNLLTFSEYFYPKSISNHYYENKLSTYNCITGGSFSAITDSDDTNYLQLGGEKSYPFDSHRDQTLINFDLVFEPIEDDFTCYGNYVVMKIDVDLYDNANITWPSLYMSILTDDSTFDDEIHNPDGSYHIFIISDILGGYRKTYSIDTTSAPVGIQAWNQRTAYNIINQYRAVPNLFDDTGYDITTGGAGTRHITQNNSTANITSLSELKNKKKLSIFINKGEGSTDGANYIRLYKIGLLIDFFVNFSDKRIVGPLTGRAITADVDTILGTSDVGTVAQYPWQVIPLILLSDLGYSTSDFDTTSWQSVVAYRTGALLTAMALSFGIDESEKGWDLCQQIASQYGLMLTKTESGKIKVIDLYKLQDTNEATGYNSITAYGISIDDIENTGGNKQLEIEQTGTDKIKNTVRINYNRNNSTDEYQSYISDTDSTVLKESGITLTTARTTYFSGQKTETMIIDAPAVYSSTAATNLWIWHINDKAEVFFYATATIPYYHFSDVNSKSTQYDIGDIIYFDGQHAGLTLSSSHKWVIRNIQKTNQGRSIIIEAKSIEPVSKF